MINCWRLAQCSQLRESVFRQKLSVGSWWLNKKQNSAVNLKLSTHIWCKVWPISGDELLVAGPVQRGQLRESVFLGSWSSLQKKPKAKSSCPPKTCRQLFLVSSYFWCKVWPPFEAINYWWVAQCGQLQRWKLIGSKHKIFLSDPGIWGPIFERPLLRLNWRDSGWWRYQLNTNQSDLVANFGNNASAATWTVALSSGA